MANPGRTSFGFVVVFALLVAAATVARAHGDLGSATPEDGAKLDAAPPEVRLSFTEAPAQGAQLTVTDGCGASVADAPTIEGADLFASVDEGAQPGRWAASYRFISDVDGHESKGKIDFSVAGKAKCEDKDKGGPQLGANPSPLARGDTGDEDSSFPWTLVVGGGLVVIVAGLLLRRLV